MKKILSFILIAVLCLGIFTGCELINKIPGIDNVINKIPGFGNDEPDDGGNTNVEYNLPRAAEYINTLYKGNPNEDGLVITQSDFTVVAQCRVAAVPYTVNWSVDNELVKLTKVKDDKGNDVWNVDVTSDSEVAYDYKLTATIIAGDGTSTEVVFNFHVNAYVLSSFEEYMAAKQDDVVTIEGVVVAINAKSLGNSRNHLFLADQNVVGGYYIYQMDSDPIKDGIKVGMTVSVTGPVSPYSGMQEIKGGVATIIDETIKDPFVPVDITNDFASGNSLKNYVGLPVTVKGVEIGGQALGGTSEYLYFKLNGIESYVRTYITDFPTGLQIVVNEDTTVTSPDKTAIDEAHAAKFGWTANVTGILVLYNSNPYLIPMDTNCFEYLELVEKTSDEKIDIVLDEITMVDKLGADKVVDVVSSNANYPEVVITWTSDSEYAVVAEDGKSIAFTIPQAETTVNITVIGSIGDVRDTRTFEVVLTPITVSYVANTPYYFGFTDKDGVNKYLDGTNPSNANYRWNLTDDVTKAAPFYVEVVDGGYHLYFFNGTTKTYLNIVKNGNYTNLLAGDTAISTWVYDVSLEALAVDLDGTIYVPKNYKGYGNVEAKTSDYVSGDTYNVGLVAIEYNFGFENNGAMQYLDGANAGGKDYRWNLTADKTLAATFYIEGNEDGSCSIYFYRDGVKTYLNIVKNGNYTNLLAGDAPLSKWVYNAEHKAYVVDVDGTLYVPKNYNNYTNVEAKTIDYTNNATFILSLYNVGYAPAASETPGEGGEGTTETPSTPAVTDGKYVFANFTAGEQYATETHKLSDTVTLAISDCHLTSQLRIYCSEPSQYDSNAHKGVAVFTLSSAAKKFVVSAGGKTGKIAVYGSTDGETWTSLTTLEPTSSYTEYEIALGEGAYTYLKLEAVDAQARVDYVIIQ